MSPIISRKWRCPDYLAVGQHQAIIDRALWDLCQCILKRRGHSPNSTARVSQVYELSGLARCWECRQRRQEERRLRGSCSNGSLRYYRCSANIDFYTAQRRERLRPPTTAGVQAVRPALDAKAPCSIQAVRADVLEEQVARVITRLAIPADLQMEIIANFLADDGLAEFQRRRHNLAESLAYAYYLHRNGVITLAELDAEQSRYTERLARLQPTNQSVASEVALSLRDFAALWPQLTPLERKGILQEVLVAVYFEGTTLRQVVANAPFDRLLGLV